MEIWSKDKSPSRIMVDLLVDIYEKEIFNLEQDDVFRLRSVGGLIVRGFVKVRPYVNRHGKEYNIPYITKSGLKFLEQINVK